MPATKPERIFSEGPPSFEALTTSATCLDLGLVKILVNSGINAAPRVPILMIVARGNQISCSCAVAFEPGPKMK